MSYYTKTGGDVTVETWSLETGYEVKLVTLHERRTTLTIQHRDEGLLFVRVYEWYELSQAQRHAEMLARFGSAGVAVAA